MPALVVLSVIIQIFFALHVVRSGKDRFWLYIILMAPGMGSLIYFLVEFLPDLFRGSHAKKAEKKIKRILDPEKEYRQLKYAYETAPTVNNCINLAQLLMARGDYDGVITLLQPALTNQFAGDPALLEGMAHAYYFKRDYANALGCIQKIFENENEKPKDYIRLLRTRILRDSGDLASARTELTELVEHYSGEEARVTLAEVCEDMGDRIEARDIYLDIVTRSKHTPPYYRKREKRWIDAAKSSLQRLS